MSDYRKVCALSDLPDGKTHPIDLEDYEIMLVRQGDTVFALEDRCSHADVPLTIGQVLPGRIKCKSHGAEFDLATGKVLAPPAFAPVRSFPVKIEDGQVWVDIE